MVSSNSTALHNAQQADASNLPPEADAQVVADLNQTVLFRGLPQAQLNEFLSRCDQAFFEKGEVLLSPDMNSGHMYLLLTGAVRVHLTSPDSEPLVTLGAGECVGEMSLFDGSNPSAWVIAARDAATLVVDSELLWDMVNESHDVARNLLYVLSRRIRSGNEAVNHNQALHKQAEEQANSDPLTGVNNRRWLEALMIRMRGRPLEDLAPLSVVMLDVDHFKRFNDDYGHQTGDEVLRMVGKAMQSSLRPNDMVARYGGEEFVILLPNTRQEHCLQVAERLREIVAQTPIKKAGESIRSVTISLGVSQWRPGVRLEDLIASADKALYRAKENGRNRICQAED